MNFPSKVNVNIKFTKKYKYKTSIIYKSKKINPLSANPTKGQTHSNNSSTKADKLFECVWPLCKDGT